MGHYYITVLYVDLLCETQRAFGPFLDADRAEQCMIVLAGRTDIIRATIVPPPKSEPGEPE